MHRSPAIVLFDFSAAFSSLDRKSVALALDAMQVARGVKNVIKVMYAPSWSYVGRTDERRTPSFKVATGAPQRCPLSGTILACATVALIPMRVESFVGRLRDAPTPAPRPSERASLAQHESMRNLKRRFGMLETQRHKGRPAKRRPAKPARTPARQPRTWGTDGPDAVDGPRDLQPLQPLDVVLEIVLHAAGHLAPRGARTCTVGKAAGDIAPST